MSHDCFKSTNYDLQFNISIHQSSYNLKNHGILKVNFVKCLLFSIRQGKVWQGKRAINLELNISSFIIIKSSVKFPTI